ncbi:hypothetical protein DXG03_003994, partial [Asterophora parasitica]
MLPGDVVEGMKTEIAATTYTSSLKEDLVAQAHAVVSLLKDNNSAPSIKGTNILGAAIRGL